MMRSISFAVAVVVGFGLVGSLWAGRIGGPDFKKRFLVPSTQGGNIGEADLVERFEGGKPARVIVVGDHDPVADLEVLVYEVLSAGGEGKLVAHDGGPGQGDRVGVVWYPPRTGTYRIVIRNPAPHSEKNPANLTQISIR